MNSYTTIIPQKIEEANAARLELENKLAAIRIERERLDQEEILINMTDQKLLAKIEAWRELLPPHNLDNKPNVTKLKLPSNVLITNSEVPKRDRRPSDKWLNILEHADNSTYSELQELAWNSYGVNKRAFNDQIRRYKTDESYLLIELEGIYHLTDKAKTYLKNFKEEKEGLPSKEISDLKE